MTTTDDYSDDDYYEVTHTVDGLELGTPFGDATVGYRAECECGWEGDWRGCVTVARQDGRVHREDAVSPPDDLDRLMTELLDLQDDLAQAVIWLAENWSAHLPVPMARGAGADRPEIVMSVSCLTTEQLDQAAAALGVPVVDDEAPDALGNRYRRANKTFGGLQLEALQRVAHREVAA